MFRAWEVGDGQNLGDGGDQSGEVEIDHGLRTLECVGGYQCHGRELSGWGVSDSGD